MNTEQTLHARSGSRCELCSTEQDLATYEVPPDSDGNIDTCVLICNTCHGAVLEAGDTVTLIKDLKLAL